MSLRTKIRAAVDGADEDLTSAEIYARLGCQTTLKSFGVTLSLMCDARNLRKRRAPKSKRTQGRRYVYGPGPAPVEESSHARAMAFASKGFMAAKREREAKARGRA